jgi:hypothetical protein
MQLLNYISSLSRFGLRPGWMLILAAMVLASCAFPCLCFAGTAQTEDARPVLFYTDLDSGPATGGENGVDGAYVCAYGENFGEKRRVTRLVFGGVEVVAYKLWHDPGAPYQPGHYAKICGQISHLTKFGSAGVQLKEPQASSNILPFTVRPGRVRFVSPTGDDKTGDGSAARPWLTVKQCKSKIESGDVCYLRDGVTVTSNESYGAAMVLDSSGSPGLPKAIMAYPGARVIIDNSATNSGRGIFNYKPNVHVSYWTIAGLTINSNQMALQLSPGEGFRFVDNDIMCTGRGCNAPEGGITATGKTDELSSVSFLGNRIHDVGCHDGPDYQNSAHPCAWIKNAPKGSRLSTSGKTYMLTEWPGSFSPGTDVMANGQVRKILALVRSGNQWTGRLDEPFVPDLPKGTIYEYRFSSPVKLYHSVYFGYVHGLDFGWNEIDGKGQACRGLQFHSTGGYDAYDLHIHDNLIHDTACDCLNVSTVDPSKGEVEVYNNVLYNCGTDTAQGMSSSFAGIYISNGSAYRDPTWWSPKHHYTVNDLIDDDTKIEKCVTAGTSGPNRPAWNRELGGKTADNDVVWRSVGPAHRRNGRVEFFNNTIYNAGLGGQRNWNTACWALSATESTTNPPIGLNATNNVCFQLNVNGQSYAFFNGFDSNHRQAGTYVAGTNNLFYGLAGAACNAMYSPTPSPADRGCPTQLVHNISVGPGFVNVSRFNFHMLPESPLRGAGVRSKHSRNDQDGVPRAEPPSIGAYE